MAKIRGNIFNYDDIDVDLKDSDIDDYKETNYSEGIKEDCLKLLNNIEIDNSPIESYELTSDNFKDYHYKLMNGKFLAIYPEGDNFKYITSNGLCFNCSDPKLIKLINTIPKPLKISFKYADETTMPLSLIIKILYGRDIKTIDELVGIFASNQFNKSTLNCYRSLINIYKKLFDIINNHSYITYLNKERDLYIIDYKSYLRSLELNDGTALINKELELESKINELINTKTFDINKSNLLDYIEHHTELPISLYEGIADLEFLELYKTYLEADSLRSLDLQSYIPHTYNYDGLISSKMPINYIIQRDNYKIIKGSFPAIYFNSLLNILRLKDYIVPGASDNYLINYIKSLNSELDVSLITTILLVLEAYICRLTTPDDIRNYLYIHKETILSNEDIDVFLEFIKDNLSDLITAIDTFNTETYKGYDVKLIEHIVFSPLNTRLKYLTSKIIKSTVIEVAKNIEYFNSKNKNKINITDITPDSIYLIAPQDISHIAIDILNRTMINSIKSTLKFDYYTCYTNIF